MPSGLFHPDLDVPWLGDLRQRELAAQAGRIAAAIRTRGPGRVVLSCRHARSFVPGLLGGWMAGATVELLPNVQPGTLDRVDADGDIAAVLHDVAATQQRSPKAIYVPAITTGRTHHAGWPEIAVRMTTSGTTERPKYVTTTMAQLTAELDVLAVAIPPATCVLSTVPLSHLYGLLFGALWPLRAGARIVSHEALLPADLAAIVAREGVDLMISTPAHLRAMATAAMPRGLRVISSGARLPEELHASLVAAHDWQVTDVLGSTETGGIATRKAPMQPWTALPGVTVSAPNGQLVVESPWCGAGRVELDDRVEVRPDGTFQYLGRNAALLKIAGKRAHAEAIESTVLAVPGITDAALLVHDVIGKEPRTALAITVDRPIELRDAREAIGAAIRSQFDAVFVPKIVKIVPRIPRSDRGKVEAAALRELFGFDARHTTDRIPTERHAAGSYTAVVPAELVFFRGHFDSYAILPGAVLVERLVWPIVKAEYPEVTALRAVRRLRFKRPVLPAQQLSITIKRDADRIGFEVTCAANLVATGQLVVQ